MRNIIICCDGTGNEISENISNVLKLYRCLRKTEKTQPRQLVYYDPGVGTLAHRPLRRRRGYGRERDRAAPRSFLLAEPGRARLYAVEPQRADLPAGDLDGRAAMHVPPEEVGHPADLQA